MLFIGTQFRNLYAVDTPAASRVMCICGPLPRRRLHRANRAGGRRISSGLIHGLLAAQGWDLYDEETTRSLMAAQNTNVEAGNGVCVACVIQPYQEKADLADSGPPRNSRV